MNAKEEILAGLGHSKDQCNHFSNVRCALSAFLCTAAFSFTTFSFEDISKDESTISFVFGVVLFLTALILDFAFAKRTNREVEKCKFLTWVLRAGLEEQLPLKLRHPTFMKYMASPDGAVPPSSTFLDPARDFHAEHSTILQGKVPASDVYPQGPADWSVLVAWFVIVFVYVVLGILKF